jgi:hypothetical protein
MEKAVSVKRLLKHIYAKVYNYYLIEKFCKTVAPI